MTELIFYLNETNTHESVFHAWNLKILKFFRIQYSFLNMFEFFNSLYLLKLQSADIICRNTF